MADKAKKPEDMLASKKRLNDGDVSDPENDDKLKKAKPSLERQQHWVDSFKNEGLYFTSADKTHFRCRICEDAVGVRNTRYATDYPISGIDRKERLHEHIRTQTHQTSTKLQLVKFSGKGRGYNASTTPLQSSKARPTGIQAKSKYQAAGPDLDNMYHFYNEYFQNEIKDLGPTPQMPQIIDAKFDQYHYEGTAAVDMASEKMGINSESTVLDVGSGVGGPARYMSWKYGCDVTALEIQANLTESAQSLTKKIGLEDKVSCVRGDILSQDLGVSQYDGLMSFLVFLHIQDKSSLWNACMRPLKRGGVIFIEDFFLKNSLTKEEETLLEKVVSCGALPTEQEYIASLERAGFVNIRFEDCTDRWGKFVKLRSLEYKADMDRHKRVHGERLYAIQQNFFDSIATLFSGGNLGGVCVTAEKPTSVPTSMYASVLPRSLPETIKSWLKEDMPSFDVGGFVVGTEPARAVLLGKSNGILAGVPFFEAVFDALDCKVEWLVEEGEAFVSVTELAIVTGRVCDILVGERVALNAVTRCSSIASQGRKILSRIQKLAWHGSIAGTRKTTPGFRLVEKYGMLVGGVDTHRSDLSHMVMLKDNHIQSVGSIQAAVRKAKSAAGFSTKIEVECGCIEDAQEALVSGADIVMLDNFTGTDLKRAATNLKSSFPDAIIEASGGVTEATVCDFISANVDVVSMGCLTQGVPSLDISLKLRDY